MIHVTRCQCWFAAARQAPHEHAKHGTTVTVGRRRSAVSARKVRKWQNSKFDSRRHECRGAGNTCSNGPKRRPRRSQNVLVWTVKWVTIWADPPTRVAVHHEQQTRVRGGMGQSIHRGVGWPSTREHNWNAEQRSAAKASRSPLVATAENSGKKREKCQPSTNSAASGTRKSVDSVTICCRSARRAGPATRRKSRDP